jgi:hypothetical protein
MAAMHKQLHTAKKAPLPTRKGSLIHPGKDLAAVFPDLNVLGFSFLVRIEGKDLGYCSQKFGCHTCFYLQAAGGPMFRKQSTPIPPWQVAAEEYV